MRIIAGIVKGRTLKSLKGLKTRPTLDKVREAVFNVLGTKVINSRFLDLFAGTGAVGIEALSRGASNCYFNDKSKAACGIIKENLTLCGLEESARVFAMDALQFISYLGECACSFDLIYVDPPYMANLYTPLLNKLEEAKLITDGGIIIAESNKKTFLQEEYNSLKLIKRSEYGESVIWYYKLLGEDECGGDN